jgi:putative transposase
MDNIAFAGKALSWKEEKEWQDDIYALSLFSDKKSTARRRYKIFVQKCIQQGKRSEFTGGGLIHSSGGKSVIKSLRRANSTLKVMNVFWRFCFRWRGFKDCR